MAPPMYKVVLHVIGNVSISGTGVVRGGRGARAQTSAPVPYEDGVCVLRVGGDGVTVGLLPVSGVQFPRLVGVEIKGHGPRHRF